MRGLLPTPPREATPPPWRLLVCGDRGWRDGALIERTLAAISPSRISVLIDGKCRGADNLAYLTGQRLGITSLRFGAGWGVYGRAAGPIRNREMYKKGKPHLVIAFHDDLPSSTGTADMLLVATKGKTPTILIAHHKMVFSYPGGSVTNTTQDVEGFIRFQVIQRL